MTHIKIRTLVVDDSVFYRSILSNALKNIKQVEFLGQAANGKLALAKIAQSPPDLVTLDVEMPGMNGIEVLQEIKQQYPDIHVVMISSATQESAEHTIEALKQGALDFIQKPDNDSREANENQLLRALRKIISIVETKIILKRGKGIDPTIHNDNQPSYKKTISPLTWLNAKNKIEIIVLGISTGGPQALPKVLSKLPANLKIPLVIVQHLPALFVHVLVTSLNNKTHLKVEVIKDQQRLTPGVIYIAPGEYQTKIILPPGSNTPTAILTKDPPENYCRPSVDYLFRSVAKVFRGNVLAIIMTGMGKDGVAGMKLLKEYGASTMAQDEESSVVFGMPMEAINANIVDKIVSLNDIGNAIMERIERK